MPELFVELLSEEIPARMQRRAAEDFKRLVTNDLVDAGLTYEGAFASATPRRLVLSVQGLPARSVDRREERRGPRVGSPDKAIEGFLRSAGLARIEDAEVEADPKKGDVYVARTLVPGRATLAVAAEAIAEAVRRFPWPKSMRWGAGSAGPAALRWVRPLTAIVATFGAENEDPDIVPVDLPGIPVGDASRGHRFHSPGPIRVRRLADYRASMERAHVVVDMDRRRDMILHDARDAAFALGLELVEDTGLLEEVAGLVEWPVVLVGRFDERALELPEEVIRLTIRENQKCFVTRDPATGRLANAFILTANIEAADGGAAIVAGNERVVRARLADARFFYEQDLRVSLDEHAKKLARVTFHEKLGSQAERVERIAALAREIAPLVGADADMAERAARLAKADLTTLMVGEFPELQGYMGRQYAEAAGEPPEVAAAIEEHYAPQGPSDDVPAAPASVAIALVDKLDTLTALWVAGQKPTGSGDAFGLRRAALGILRIIRTNNLRVNLVVLLAQAYYAATTGVSQEAKQQLARLLGQLRTGGYSVSDPARVKRTDEMRRKLAESVSESEIFAFMDERQRLSMRDEGHQPDVIEAVMGDYYVQDYVAVLNCVRELQSFLDTDDGANLLAGYRRATNILRAEEKKDGTPVDGNVEHNVLVEAEELHLAGAVEVAEVRVREAVAREDYAAAMAELAALRAPVDAFFEKVLVNADDPQLRLNRLRILAELRNATLAVADFSAISGG